MHSKKKVVSLTIVSMFVLVTILATGLPYGKFALKALAQYSYGTVDRGPAPSAPFPGEIIVGSVKAFRVGGTLQVYAGFDAFPPNGFLVGIVDLSQCPSDAVFADDGPGALNPGWTLTCPNAGFVEVRNAAGVLVAIIPV
jgi:hypothetical protein